MGSIEELKTFGILAAGAITTIPANDYRWWPKWDPKVGLPKTKDEFFHKFVSPDRAMSRAVQERHLALVDLEFNNRCLGACAYCFSSSHPQGEITMPTEKALSH